MRFVSCIFLCLTLLGCASSPHDRTTVGTFPVYGNWCGPDHPRSGTNPPPIDAVDAACRKHDFCYAQKNYFACDCDNQLLADLATIKNNKWNGRKQVSGDEYFQFESPTVRAIRAYFAATGCAPSHPAEVVSTIPIKAITALDVGTDAVARTSSTVITTGYSIIIAPFYLIAKGLCAISNVPSCVNVGK